MKHVIFANAFKTAAAPDANNKIALFNPVTGAYIAQNHSSGNVTTWSEMVIQYMRDSQIISIPYFPQNMTIAAKVETLTSATAQTVAIDLTGATSGAATGDSYTLEIIHKGYPNDNRCRKYVTAVFNSTYSGTKVTTDATLATVLTAMINALSMPYIAFTAAAGGTSNETITITASAGYYSEELAVNGLDELDVLVINNDSPGNLKITHSHTIGWTAAKIQAIEAEADSILGDHSTSLRTGEIFTLESGYLAACNSLVIIRTSKPDDDTLVLEPNVQQEIYLFYDHDAAVDTGITVNDVIDFIVGTHDTITD